MTAQAIVFRQANQPRLEELPLPTLAPGEVQVRVHYSGVSIGTEQSIFSGERTHNGTFPLVGGYMAAGEIEAVGSEVRGLAVGDRVVCSGVRLGGGVTSVWGAHCSRQVLAAGGCFPVPAGVDLRHAAMYVLPGVGLNAVNMAQVQLTDRVLIQGQGLIGQFCGQWARNRGALVITLEPEARRRELSRQLVTEHALDPTDPGTPARIAELTGGAGPTVVIEATASSRFIESASAFLQPGGKFIFLSWYPGEVKINFAHFHNNQITAYFPTGAGGWEAARATLGALSSGSLQMEANITDEYPYDRAVEGYQRIIDGDRNLLGMIIDWTKVP